MPLGSVKPEPVGEAVKTSHLAHADAAGIAVVDRAGTREGAARAVRPGSQGIRHAVRGQLVEPADGLHLAGLGRREPGPRNLGMVRAGAGSQERGVPVSNVAVVPSIVCEAPQLGGIVRGLGQSCRSHHVRVQEAPKTVDVGQIADRFLTRGPVGQLLVSHGPPRDLGGRRGVVGEGCARLRTHEYETLTRLWHAVVRCIEHAPWEPDPVAGRLEGRNQLAQERLVRPDGQAFDVLEDEGARI